MDHEGQADSNNPTSWSANSPHSTSVKSFNFRFSSSPLLPSPRRLSSPRRPSLHPLRWRQQVAVLHVAHGRVAAPPAEDEPHGGKHVGGLQLRQCVAHARYLAGQQATIQWRGDSQIPQARDSCTPTSYIPPSCIPPGISPRCTPLRAARGGTSEAQEKGHEGAADPPLTLRPICSLRFLWKGF